MTDSSRSGPWWELHFSCSDPDDFAAATLALGAGGAVLTDDHHVTCYLQGEQEHLEDFCRRAAQLGGVFISSAPVESRNWTEDCPELWEPLRILQLDIIPVESEEQTRAATPRPEPFIKILPGMGFGTGHHASTANVLELLQSDALRRNPPRRVLDVGTGSGILAIAARKLFGAAVSAIDNDPLALENAATNARLNDCDSKIDISGTPAAQVDGTFDLILANIYAEVLQSLRPDFERLLAANGRLIVSGIMLPLASELQQNFERHAWTIESRLERSGWVGLVLQRASATRS